MIILVEGMDGSGKSTLAAFLSQCIGWPIIHSGGPEKFDGEINTRIQRFLEHDATIFDRFPAVSEAIYAPILRGVNPISASVFAAYQRKRKVVIYCRSDHGLRDHVVKDNGIDTPEHVGGVVRHFEELRLAYEDWGSKNADIIYSLGRSSPHRIRDMVQGAIRG